MQVLLTGATGFVGSHFCRPSNRPAAGSSAAPATRRLLARAIQSIGGYDWMSRTRVHREGARRLLCSISKHLGSRRRTGELLRASKASTIEIRAAMIIGEGSASWTMVKDLAARLPATLLPKWIALVTRGNHELAQALVEGGRYDLEPQEDILWETVGHEPIGLEAAAELALAAESSELTPSPHCLRIQGSGTSFKRKYRGAPAPRRPHRCLRAHFLAV